MSKQLEVVTVDVDPEESAVELPSGAVEEYPDRGRGTISIWGNTSGDLYGFGMPAAIVIDNSTMFA